MPKAPSEKVDKHGKIPTTIRLAPEIYRALMAKAKKENEPKNKIVECILSEYLDKVTFGMKKETDDSPQQRLPSPRRAAQGEVVGS